MARDTRDTRDVFGAEYPVCGAKLRNKDAHCRRVAGERTPHYGEGRCYLHGGAAGSGRPVIHGRYSKRFGSTFAEEIEKALQSPDLLSLDREVATMKVALERQIEAISQRDDAVRAWSAQYDPLDEDAPPCPAELSVDRETIKTLISAVRNAFEMRFSKRFSIPIKDLQALLAQVAALFNDMCVEYGIPMEGREAFAEGLRRLRIPQLEGDPQLEAAGMGEVHSSSIEIDLDDADGNSGAYSVDNG